MKSSARSPSASLKNGTVAQSQPVRPEARRAYVDNTESTSVQCDKNLAAQQQQRCSAWIMDDSRKRMLQQAANYASLAPSSNFPVSEKAAHIPPSPTSKPKIYSSCTRSPAEELETWEAAPRLSMSSAESCVSSEIKTPESTHAHPIWNHTQDPVQKTLRPSEVVELADAKKGRTRISGSTETKLDAEKSPAQTKDLLRNSTVKKRPDSLLKMPHESFRTDTTVTPESNASSTAGLTPQAEEPSADVQDPMDRMTAELSAKVHVGANKDKFDTLESPYPKHNLLPSAVPPQDVTSPEHVEERIASPDSWRSLLPEHDPYYMPQSMLSSPTTSQAGTVEGRASIGSRTDDTTGSRRWSMSSQRSIKSLPSATAISVKYAPANGNHLLYDVDTSLSESGSRAAFAPLHYQYNGSNRSLTSPTLHYESGTRRGGTADVSSDSRRHASFSAFDNSLARSRASLTHAPFVHPDYVPKDDGRRLNVSPPVLSKDTSGTAMQIKNSTSSSGTAPRSPSSNSAVEDEVVRGCWPSSRNSLRPQLRAQDSMVETKKRDDRLTNDVNTDGSFVGSPPNIVSTSTVESVLSNCDGAVTTRTTTTTTTTTTQMLQSNAPAALPISATSPPSEEKRTSIYRPIAPSSDITANSRSATCQGHTVRDMPHDITPLSPRSMPFLDSRPAPPTTEYSMDTHHSHYTLKIKLPGFSLEGITLATKHSRQLVIVADKWDEANGGHFERRLAFGPDADLNATKASFDGDLLRITIPRRS